MTVGELQDALAQYPRGADVIVAVGYEFFLVTGIDALPTGSDSGVLMQTGAEISDTL